MISAINYLLILLYMLQQVLATITYKMQRNFSHIEAVIPETHYSRCVK